MRVYGINYFGDKVINKCGEYVTDDILRYSDWLNTSNSSVYTFFIHNTGFRAAYIYAQVSPDKITIINDPYETEILPGETQAIVTQKYGFFTRIAFKSLVANNITNLKIIFQAQER